MATKPVNLVQLQVTATELKNQYVQLQASKQGKNIDQKVNINNQLISLYTRIFRHNNRIMQLGGVPTDDIDVSQILLANLIIGDGEPLNTLGENGQVYLDNLTGNYYLKKNGSW